MRHADFGAEALNALVDRTEIDPRGTENLLVLASATSEIRVRAEQQSRAGIATTPSFAGQCCVKLQAAKWLVRLAKEMSAAQASPSSSFTRRGFPLISAAHFDENEGRERSHHYMQIAGVAAFAALPIEIPLPLQLAPKAASATQPGEMSEIAAHLRKRPPPKINASVDYFSTSVLTRVFLKPIHIAGHRPENVRQPDREDEP